MTHRTPFTPAFRLVEMLDVATDTTVESTMIMKNPTRTAQSACQALRSESEALNCLNSVSSRLRVGSGHPSRYCDCNCI